MHHLKTFAIFAWIASMLGCGNPGSMPSTPSNPTSPAEGAKTTPAKFAPVEISIYAKFGTCTTTFTPLRETTIGSTCAGTKVSWRYLGTTDEGDRYGIEIVFPLDEPNQTIVPKEFVYSGKELVLFHQDNQRIVMRPAGSNEPRNAADRKPAAET